jgi:hypothetical protein
LRDHEDRRQFQCASKHGGSPGCGRRPGASSTGRTTSPKYSPKGSAINGNREKLSGNRRKRQRACLSGKLEHPNVKCRLRAAHRLRAPVTQIGRERPATY